jgi:hypothetical protein
LLQAGHNYPSRLGFLPAQALEAENGSFTIAGARPLASAAEQGSEDDSGLPDSGMFALFSD